MYTEKLILKKGPSLDKTNENKKETHRLRSKERNESPVARVEPRREKTLVTLSLWTSNLYENGIVFRHEELTC
jgi:hypothetical protein